MEKRAFSPRLLLQEYGYISIQERSVSSAVNGRKQAVLKGLQTEPFMSGSTIQTNYPAQSMMKLKIQRRLNDTMTLEIQKTSNATSFSSTRQKCAPKPKTTHFYPKPTQDYKPHWVAVPCFHLYYKDYKLCHHKTFD